MKTFVLLNADGFPLGFYNEAVHGERMRLLYGEMPAASEEDPDPVAPIIGQETNPDCMIPDDAIEISTDAWSEFLANQGRRKWVDGKLVEYMPPATPVDLNAYNKNASWLKEVGGITIAGIPVATDDRSQLKILGSRVAANADPSWSTDWDAANDQTFPIDAAMMIMISDAVAAHVNRCFSIRATVKAAIAAGTVTTTAEIDAAFA